MFNSAAQRLLAADMSKPDKRPAITRPPPSAVLDRLKAFLPQMATANQELEAHLHTHPDEAGNDRIFAEGEDVEDGKQPEGPYVEMNLGCGVLDIQDQAGLDAAQAAVNGAGAGPLHVALDDESDSESESEGSDMGAGEESFAGKKGVSGGSEDAGSLGSGNLSGSNGRGAKAGKRTKGGVTEL